MSDSLEQPKRSWRRIDFAMLAIVLLVALAGRALTIDRPFHRDPEGCGSFYGTLARNYLRYPILENFAVPIQSIGVVPDQPTYYQNHPPLLPLLIAGTYKLIGWNATSNAIPPDWATRLSTTLFTIACPATIFVMLRSRASLRAATLAGVLFSIMPMTIVFGSQPDVINTQLCFFALLTMAAYLHFHDRPNFKRFAMLCAAFAPAAASDWPAFHLVPVLGLHFVATRPIRKWPWIIAFGLVSACLFASLYAQVVAVTDDWRWMGRLVQRRAMSDVSDAADKITFMRWMTEAIAGHAWRRHSYVLILALIWIPLAIRARRVNDSTPLIALLLGWATLHVLIGRQGVFVHEWWWWPLTPAVAMAAGVTLDRLLTLVETRRAPRAVTTSVIAMLLLVFGIINFRAAHHELAHPFGMSDDPAMDYSIIEIGDAIRAAAPRDRAVMLAEDDKTLSLWFYADRPIKQRVWDIATFRQRLNDGHADAHFGLVEASPQPAAAFVMPRAYNGLDELTGYLDAHYPRRESDKFYTWDLTARQP